jgi:hypothetical protein
VDHEHRRERTTPGRRGEVRVDRRAVGRIVADVRFRPARHRVLSTDGRHAGEDHENRDERPFHSLKVNNLGRLDKLAGSGAVIDS